MADEHVHLALHTMSNAILAISSELSWDAVLQKLVDGARELAGARYAALGIPDGEGGFEEFITSGMSDEQIAAIGWLPRTHGMLGVMLQDAAPYRAADIQQDPRFVGWPAPHPSMHTFMGVPVVAKGTVVAAFYLTDKLDAPAFTEEDEHIIAMLAAHAAIAIENARLFERSRELTVIEERNRLARELHDSVTQTIFSVVLTAEAASTLVDRDPGEAKVQLTHLQGLARGALEEMRSLIFELRSADLAADGLVATLRKHIDVVRRVRSEEIELRVAAERPLPGALERELFRIAQEALNNAFNHANARSIEVSLEFASACVALTVRDDGIGFDPQSPAIRSKRLGLTSMRERAEAIGATLRIDSAPGAGTVVRLEAPLG